MTHTLPPAERILSGHVDEDTAYVIGDYPYGFRLRCQMRLWLETNKNGDRLCSQTTNPKVDNEAWSNKPKRSTYSDVGVMYLDDEDHVKWTAVSVYTEIDRLREFQTVTDGKLTETQAKRLALMIRVRAAYDAQKAGREACERGDDRLVPRDLLCGPDAKVGDNTEAAKAWYRGWDGAAAKREVTV